MRNIAESFNFTTTVSTNRPGCPCHDRFLFSDVLSNEPTLLDVVRNVILMYVSNLREFLTVTGVKITGTCLSLSHPQDCPVEVWIEVDNREHQFPTDWKYHSAYKDISLIQNTPLPTNPHTINFTVVNRPKRDGAAGYPDQEDVYDVEENRWIKHESLDRDNMENAMKADVEKFLTDLSRRVAVIDLKVDDVNRAVLDAEKLEKRFRASQLPELKRQLEARLAQIESDVRNILRKYERLNRARAAEYRDADSGKLSELAKRAELPEDVVHRLLERYYYTELSKNLNKILDGGPVTADSIVDIKRVFSDFASKQRRSRRS